MELGQWKGGEDLGELGERKSDGNIMNALGKRQKKLSFILKLLKLNIHMKKKRHINKINKLFLF